MAAVDDVGELIERYHQALRELVNGNPEPLKEIYSYRDDASLANPFGRQEGSGSAPERAARRRDHLRILQPAGLDGLLRRTPTEATRRGRFGTLLDHTGLPSRVASTTRRMESTTSSGRSNWM
jgi:hypothetical protein